MSYLTLYLPEELKQAIRMAAAINRMSMNKIITDLLEWHFWGDGEKKPLQNETKKRSNKKKTSKPKVEEEEPIEKDEQGRNLYEVEDYEGEMVKGFKVKDTEGKVHYCKEDEGDLIDVQTTEVVEEE